MDPLEADAIRQAVEFLTGGRVIAIPTDTVYGLAASLTCPEALKKIYAIKGRDAGKALPVLVDGIERINEYGDRVPEAASVLAKAFWPGALTIVVPASPLVPDEVHRGAGTVGLRMPDNRIALALISAAGGALAVTSANLSGRSEAKSASEVQQTLGSSVALVVDGGIAQGGIPSTVVDLTGTGLQILREGVILRHDLEQVLAEHGLEFGVGRAG